MSGFFDKLNLRPAERRLVVVVGLVIFVILNIWFVFPMFGEWGQLQAKSDTLNADLKKFDKEIANSTRYQKDRDALKQKGARVESSSQALELQRVVTSQAAINGVSISGYTPGRAPSGGSSQTNAFFEEQTGTISFTSEESSLVNFLYSLSSGNSLIRVSSMTLNPDPSRMKLVGSMTLVASYPKAPPPKTIPMAPAPSATKPGVKPAGTNAVVAAATNAPSVSLWTKIKRLFTKSPSAPTPPKAPATNAPAVKPK